MDNGVTKRVSDSLTEQVRLIMPMHLNGTNRLFGGQLTMWIDEVAGIAALRHVGGPVTTVAIDNLRFREPVFQNEMLLLRAKVSYVGNTSLEVRVDSYAESPNGDRKLINTAFLIMVAIDGDGKPCKVPALTCENEFEEKEFSAGRMRQEFRKKLNTEIYN